MFSQESFIILEAYFKEEKLSITAACVSLGLSVSISGAFKKFTTNSSNDVHRPFRQLYAKLIEESPEIEEHQKNGDTWPNLLINLIHAKKPELRDYIDLDMLRQHPRYIAIKSGKRYTTYTCYKLEERRFEGG